ncbi:MAG: ABC transporter ATP-binding protein [Planctomycetota bacterium]
MIKLENIRREFMMAGTPLRVLHDINLEIGSGEYVSIMGPSGSGKSSLLNILGCLDRPTAGRYTLNGSDTSTMDETELARIRNAELGFIFQRFHLIPRLNIVENVCLPLMFRGLEPREREALAVAALEKLGLGHRLGHRTNEISGGECQRVAIARAIVTRPKVLLADEPTGNLDTRSGRVILDRLAELHAEGLVVVLVTHDPSAATEARRRIRLVDGRIESDTVT